MPRTVIFGHMCSWSGWGRLTELVGRALEAQGLEVAVWPSLWDDWFAPHTEWMTSRKIEAPNAGEFVLSINPPWIYPEQHPFAALTMWEVDRLPPLAPDRLNRAAWVATPSRWGVEGFRRSGVRVPIHHVPLAAGNLEVLPRVEERSPGPFVFGCAGRWESGGERKGIAEVARAFELAFPGEPNVRLEVKCFPDCVVPRVRGDDRIAINRQVLTDHEMADWYRGLDCYVTASRGEGWGFQAFEAIASGVPVIGIRLPGSEFLGLLNCQPVAYTLEPAVGVYAKCDTQWLVPDVEHMAHRMREAFEDGPYDLATRTVVSRTVAEYWWDRTGKVLVEMLAS